MQVEYYKYLREYVGHRPIILPGAVGLIFNNEGKILLDKRTSGSYGLPGGFMDLGESFEEVMIREVKEETSLCVTEYRFLKLYSGSKHHIILENGDEMYVITAAFVVEKYDGSPCVNSEESLEIGFYDLNNLPSSLIPAHHQIIQDFKVTQ